MIRSVIVAVGGTGQLVLHYYAQLYQIGAITDPFHAVVVDSDKLLLSLQKVQSFWQTVRLGYPNVQLAPQLEYFPVAANLHGRVMNAVVGGDLPSAPAIHAAEAFLDSESLTQDVKEGLYARPALSAVMQTDWSRFPLGVLTGFQRVLVVGSLIGGTGGGLIAPLLNQLAMRIRNAAAAEQPRMRAVFFGEYFNIKGNSPVRDALKRYPSNKLFLARCLKDLAPPELEHFAFIEPKTLMDRDPGEADALNRQWPANLHDPIWMAISALEELRKQTTWENSQHFGNKEKDGLPPRDLAEDNTKLRYRLGIAEALRSHTVLEHIPKEPWVKRFYGRELPGLIARAHSAGRKESTLGIAGLRSFSQLLQESYNKQWSDLRSVFPKVAASETDVAALRATKWSELNIQNNELRSSRDKLTAGTSALVLFEALRGGW